VLEKGFGMSCLDDHLRGRRRVASARNYMVLAGTYFHARCYGDFIRCAGRAVAMDLRQSWRLIGFPVRALRRAEPAHSALVETLNEINAEGTLRSLLGGGRASWPIACCTRGKETGRAGCGPYTGHLREATGSGSPGPDEGHKRIVGRAWDTVDTLAIPQAAQDTCNCV